MPAGFEGGEEAGIYAVGDVGVDVVDAFEGVAEAARLRDAGDVILDQRIPRDVLRRLRLLVRPDTVHRRYRNLVTRRHAAALPRRDRSAWAGRAPCTPSALWPCAWPWRTPTGATGASMANC